MKKNCFLILLAIIHVAIYAQTEPGVSDSISEPSGFQHKRSIQFEALGPGSMCSFGFEQIIVNRWRWKTAVFAGAFGMKSSDWWGFSLPVSVTQIRSFDKHHFEVGGGLTFGMQESTYYVRETIFMLTARLGYRYQKPSGRFVFRIGYTPLIWEGYQHWGGIAVGYCF